VSETAWGYAIATIGRGGTPLCYYFSDPQLGAPDDAEQPEPDVRDEYEDAIRGVIVRSRVRVTADLDAPPADVADAYLRLHLLSHRLVRPNSINLDGIFKVLPNVCWTSLGPVEVSEIAAVREACAGAAHLKVILETGELVTLDNVRRASWLAMLAGADFIKTSTGKVSPAATLPVTLVMLEAVRDYRESHGRQVGVKAAGGIRTAKDAIRYLVLVNETAGDDWLDPDWFRLGASSLLNDLLMQRTKMTTGRYSGPDYFTLDS